MIETYVICASNLRECTNYSTVSIKIYANRNSKVRIGKTFKAKIRDNTLFDVDKRKPFYIPFVLANTIEFEVVCRSPFKPKYILGSAIVPLSNISEEITFDIPITSMSHINNDAKLTILINPRLKSFELLSSTTSIYTQIPSSWKSPLFIYVSSNHSDQDIDILVDLSIFKFHQLGRYPSILTKDSTTSMSGMLPPIHDNSIQNNKLTTSTSIYEINPELLTPFYYTPIIHNSGFRGTLYFNIVSDLSTSSNPGKFDFRIIKQTSVEIDSDGFYSSGLVFWPKSHGRVGFIVKSPIYEIFDNDDIVNDIQTLSQSSHSLNYFSSLLAPNLKTSYKNGPLTQEVRRRLYQAEEDEATSLNFENVSDFTLSLFPPDLQCSLDFVKDKSNQITMTPFLFDTSNKPIETSLIVDNCDNKINLKLFELSDDVKYVIIAAKTDATLASQVKLSLIDNDNSQAVATSLTFLVQNNAYKIIVIFYRISHDRWNMIEGQDWITTKDTQKIPTKIIQNVLFRMGSLNRNVKKLKKRIVKYQNDGEPL